MNININEIKNFLLDAVKDIAAKSSFLFKKNDNVESFKNSKGKIDVKQVWSAIRSWFTVHRFFSRGLVLALCLCFLCLYVDGNSVKAIGSDGKRVESFKINQNASVAELMTNYYSAYANADLDTISTLATPISNLEKGYITLIAGYVDHYDNISCYTKSGLEEGSYFVCVSMNMVFYGIDTPAPGVETFYVRTAEDGALYIDNIYSTFNMQTNENPLDETMAARIEEFEQESDVVELCSQVSTEYAEAISNDPGLNALITTSLPTAIGNWMNSAVEEQAEEEAQASADAQAAAEEAAAAAEEAQAAEQAAEEAEAEAEAAESEDESANEDTDISAEEMEENNDSVGGAGYFIEGDIVYITSTVNIRKGMSTDSDLMGTAYSGDSVQVIISYAEGWTKVQWGSKTGYIRTDVLLEQ